MDAAAEDASRATAAEGAPGRSRRPQCSSQRCDSALVAGGSVLARVSVTVAGLRCVCPSTSRYGVVRFVCVRVIDWAPFCSRFVCLCRPVVAGQVCAAEK